MSKRLVLLICVLLASAGASAGPVFAGFDLADFDFDVTAYDPGTGNGTDGTATASGTSNGIAWNIGPTSLWTGRTTVDGTFDFINAGTNILGKSTDNLHTSIDFTVTFAETVGTLIVALGNDNTSDSLDFGLAPAALQGVTVSGTQLALAANAQAGLVMFTNVDALSVTHVNGNGLDDGFDFAFHVQSVPAPAPVALLGLGLLLLVGRRRRA